MVEDHGTRNWTFLSNHAHVLICMAQAPEIRIRDIAQRVGITERAASSIVADLESAGYLTRSKIGRNNRYELHDNRPLRHPIERHRSIGDLLALLAEPSASEPSPELRGEVLAQVAFNG